MTSTSSTTTQTKTNLVLVKETNEWGQLTDLDKNATYFVIRKPTKELTKEKTQEFVEDVRAFLHEHRVLSEKQFEEINSRYGEPAKAKAKELRETMEKKFDEIAKEFEARVEQLETEIQSRFGKAKETTPAPAQPATTAETPGEMPSGETPEASAETKAKTGAPKKAAKKSE